MRKFKLVKELFPVGIVLEEGVTHHEDYGPQYDVVVGIGKDYTAHLLIDKETVEKNPDYFEEIN